MIKVIDCIYLTEKGCSVKTNGKFYPVHLQQGDIDGACSVYALMMNLLILKTITRRQVENVFNDIRKSPEVEQLFHEMFDKHGLVRGGFHFNNLKKLINHSFGDVVFAEYFEKRNDDIYAIIKETIDNNIPIILGIDFKGGGGHAVLAIGYERDVDGIFNIFCLDPGYSNTPTSYWNMVISLGIYQRSRFPHQCLTVNPYNCPAIQITDILVITKK